MAYFLAKDMRPVNLVEGSGFVELMKEMDPKFTIPSRRTVTRVLMPKLEAQEREKLKTDLAKTPWISLTTDMWSSRTNSAFLNITAHYLLEDKIITKVLSCERFPQRHTGENIKEALLKTLQEFEIQSKVVTVTTDNAHNMKNAVKGAGLQELGCMAHTLNLCAQEVLDKDPDLMVVRKKIKEIVKATRTSHNVKVELENCQSRLGRQTRSLVMEVKTR